MIPENCPRFQRIVHDSTPAKLPQTFNLPNCIATNFSFHPINHRPQLEIHCQSKLPTFHCNNKFDAAKCSVLQITATKKTHGLSSGLPSIRSPNQTFNNSNYHHASDLLNNKLTLYYVHLSKRYLYSTPTTQT